MSSLQLGENSRNRRIYSATPRITRGYSPLKIGIFAGTFDPVHDGHLAVAENAVQALELDQLYFMVEKSPWTNKKPVELAHRKKMVNIATRLIAKISQLDIDDERFTLQQTLPALVVAFKADELYFVFGGDVFMGMSTQQWPGLDSLLKHYIVVFERGEVTEAVITEHAKSLGIAVAILPSEFVRHTSSDVRMQPQNKHVWVPKAVTDYIDEHTLYS